MTSVADRTASFEASDSASPGAARGTTPQRGYFFGPLTDFLYLGGGSLIVLGAIIIFLPQGIAEPQIASLMVVLMLLINQPHFAHSYQLFYRNFRNKAFGQYARALRLRYILAGIIVPIVLAFFLAVGTLIALRTRNTQVLGYGFNLMFFLVGWHYVKQGYGILIVDSVQKSLVFSESEKRVLRFNSYACWLLTWIGLNNTVANVAPQLGIAYGTLALPTIAYQAIVVAGVASTIGAVGVLFQAWWRLGSLPWIGVVAYLTTLYLWVMFARINPLVYLIIPTFHSLQYLTVVWRYELNAGEVAKRMRALAWLDRIIPDTIWRRLVLFVGCGIGLGYVFMDGLPRFLDIAIAYDYGTFGTNVFLFSFLLFINVHHYFLDSVMWRRGNPDIRQLFRPPSPARQS
jgi:hypothetical protein